MCVNTTGPRILRAANTAESLRVTAESVYSAAKQSHIVGIGRQLSVRLGY